MQKLFPDWVKWEYIRDLFVIADYEKPKKLKAEFTVYKEHRKEYPYGMYIHWRPDGRKSAQFRRPYIKDNIQTAW